MARTATGQVVEDARRRSPTFGLRFRAYGKRHYMTLGSRAEGWTYAKAEQELANVMADVRRGIWQPPKPEPVTVSRETPTFHEYASAWLERRRLEGGRRGGGLSTAGVADLEWRLSYHLLPFFAKMRLDEIRIEDVDRFRLVKVRERDAIEKATAAGEPLLEDYTDPRTGRTRQRRRTALGPVSINKLIGTLSAILDAACEVELVPRNVAAGRRRRLPSVTPPRTTLDSAEHIAALLDGATGLDQDARSRHGQRRALLATLVFAGLRISEALSLRWSDVDLARGTLKVRQGKTAAAARTINLLPILRDELSAYAARMHGAPDTLVFGTTTGGRENPSNIRRRVLAKAVGAANETLAATGVELMSAKLTPHSLRRTYASILFAVGEPAPYVMQQLGHVDAKMTLGVYARVMNRRDGEPERLRALVEGADWAALGSSSDFEGSSEEVTDDARLEK